MIRDVSFIEEYYGDMAPNTIYRLVGDFNHIEKY